MITWHEGSTYPNPEALVKIFQSKKHDCAKSTTRYIAAALILTAALLFASREWTVVLGGLITVAFTIKPAPFSKPGTFLGQLEEYRISGNGKCSISVAVQCIRLRFAMSGLRVI